MDQQIIDALNLELTNLTLGAGFQHNEFVYKWPAMSTEGREVYLMSCDQLGRPMANMILAIAKQGAERYEMKFTKELALNVELIGQIVKNEFDKSFGPKK